MNRDAVIVAVARMPIGQAFKGWPKMPHFAIAQIKVDQRSLSVDLAHLSADRVQRPVGRGFLSWMEGFGCQLSPRSTQVL
jgi:hypothetical protein